MIRNAGLGTMGRLMTIPLYPYTDIDDLRIFLSYLTDANPTLRNLKLAEFVDNSYLKRVEQDYGSSLSTLANIGLPSKSRSAASSESCKS